MGGGGAPLGCPVACWGVDRHSVQQQRLVPFGPHLFPIPADEGSFVAGIPPERFLFAVSSPLSIPLSSFGSEKVTSFVRSRGFSKT